MYMAKRVIGLLFLMKKLLRIFFTSLFFKANLFFLLLLLLLLLLLFLGPHPRHMEVPRLGVESEL